MSNYEGEPDEPFFPYDEEFVQISGGNTTAISSTNSNTNSATNYTVNQAQGGTALVDGGSPSSIAIPALAAAALLTQPSRGARYTDSTVKQIKTIYIIAIILWLVLIVVLGLFCMDIIVLALLSIPLVAFIISYLNICHCDGLTEGEMFKGNFVPFASLVVIVMINWNSPAISDKSRFFKIIITAFILLMLSLVDIWVRKDRMTLAKHVKTCLQTAALSLLATALYVYYRDQSSYTGSW